MLQSPAKISETKETRFSTYFPNPITQALSVLFMQKIVGLSISTICYMRKLLPPECYVNQMVDGLPLRLLSDKSPNPESRHILKIMRGAFDAIDKGYLKQLIFAIHEGSTKGPVLETYTYFFKYTYLNVECTLQGNSGAITEQFNVGKVEDIPNALRSSTLNLLKSCLLLKKEFRPLPANSVVTSKLLYYENTPAEYEPCGFQPADGSEHVYICEQTPEKFTLGNIVTKFHEVKLQMKSVCHKKENLTHSQEMSTDVESSATSKFLVPVSITSLEENSKEELDKTFNQGFSKERSAIVTDDSTDISDILFVKIAAKDKNICESEENIDERCDKNVAGTKSENLEIMGPPKVPGVNKNRKQSKKNKDINILNESSSDKKSEEIKKRRVKSPSAGSEVSQNKKRMKLHEAADNISLVPSVSRRPVAKRRSLFSKNMNDELLSSDIITNVSEELVPASGTNVTEDMTNTSPIMSGKKRRLFQKHDDRSLTNHDEKSFSNRNEEDANETDRASEVSKGDITDDEDKMVQCECNIKKEFSLMVQCDYCKTWQHAACYGKNDSEFIENHCCVNCAKVDSSRECSDPSLLTSDKSKYQTKCVFRCALVLCAELETIGVELIADTLCLSKKSALSLINVLQKLHILPPGSHEPHMKVNKNVLTEKMQKEFLTRTEKDK